jgi:hypothetical protein
LDNNSNNRAPKAYSGDGSHLGVDAVYWEEIARRDRIALCNYSFFELAAPDQFQFHFLNEDIRVDLSNRCLLRGREDAWVVDDDPLLTLATVVYLKNINSIYPLGKDIVGVRDLREGHFFAGPHELRTGALLKRFGNDLEGFLRTGVALDGQPVDMADAALRLLPFPRVPLYFLLWTADDEFQPRLQVLFDRSIEDVLPADAIWALVNCVSSAYARA